MRATVDLYDNTDFSQSCGMTFIQTIMEKVQSENTVGGNSHGTFRGDYAGGR